MDGFKNRLTGRYDRSDKNSTKENRYDRSNDNRYERLTKKTESISIDAISEAIDKSNRAQLGEIANLLKDTKCEKEDGSNQVNSVSSEMEILKRLERMTGRASETISENEAILSRTYEMVREQGEMIKDLKGSASSVNPLPEQIVSEENNDKEELLEAISDNRALLNLIRQDLNSNTQKTDEDEVKSFSSAEAEKQFHDLSDHVHIQCVKTFRNIQANLNDQTTELTKQVKGANSNLNIIAIASVCLNFVTLVLIVCQILGIFG